MRNEEIENGKLDFDSIKENILNESFEKFEPENLNSNILFENTEINELVLKNKFCFYNLTDDFLYKCGTPTDDYLRFYENIARSDVGLIFTGGVYAGLHENKKQQDIPCIDSSLNQETFYKDFTSKIHTTGAKIFLTIKSAYGRADSFNKKFNIFNLSSSFNADYNNVRVPTLRISDGDCDYISKEFGKYANFARRANFDGILIDGSLFGLLGEFTSSEFNRRIFGYYSDISDLPLKILKEIKKQVGNINIIYEFSFDSFINEVYAENYKLIKSIDMINNKFDKSRIFDLMAKLVAAGVDGFMFKFGTYETEFLSEFNQFECENIFEKLYLEIREYFNKNKIKNKFNNNVIIISQDNFVNINKISREIENKSCDFIDVTKNIYANSNYVKNLKSHIISNLCIKCSVCNNLSTKMKRVECTINPNLLSEDFVNADKYINKKVAVVGAGVSGINCANILADRGFSVELYEEKDILNYSGRLQEIFESDYLLKRYNDEIETRLKSNIKSGRIKLQLNRKFDAGDVKKNEYFSVIVSTGFKEKFLEVVGAVLKNVKSIYEVLDDKELLYNKNNIIIYANSELSLKTAIYVSNIVKNVSIIINNTDFLHKMPNDRLTYYLYKLSNMRIKVYVMSRLNRIENDFVEVIINNKIKTKFFPAVILNSKMNKELPFEPRAMNLDYDLLIYEPEIYSNNRLYYDLVKDGFKGEIYLIGNALSIGDMNDDIKSAYYVAKNLWLILDINFPYNYNFYIRNLYEKFVL